MRVPKKTMEYYLQTAMECKMTPERFRAEYEQMWPAERPDLADDLTAPEPSYARERVHHWFHYDLPRRSRCEPR